MASPKNTTTTNSKMAVPALTCGCFLYWLSLDDFWSVAESDSCKPVPCLSALLQWPALLGHSFLLLSCALAVDKETKGQGPGPSPALV